MAATETPTVKRRPGRPSIYHNVSEVIKAAALDLFAERGFEATSIGDIAEKAQVPKANVMYYFKTKDDIWRIVVDAQWNQINQFYAQKLRAPLPLNRTSLELAIRTFFEACQRFPAYTKIPALEGNSDTWRSRWIAERHLAPHITATRNFHSQLFAAGIVRNIDPLVFQTLLGGSGHLFFGQAALWRIAEGSGRSEEVFTDLFVEGLLRLLSTVE